MKRIFTHWKTTSAGLLVLIFTGLVTAGEITIEQWITATGGIASVVGILSKDWDKP